MPIDRQSLIGAFPGKRSLLQIRIDMNIIDFKTAAASKGKIIFLYLPCLWYFHDNYFGFGLVKDGSLRRFRVRKHQHEASQRESDEHLGHSDHDRDGGGYSAYFEYPVDKRLNRVEFNKPFGFWNWEIPKLAWMNRYSIMDQNWSILGSLVSYKSPIDPDMVFTGRVVARPKDQISPRLTCYGEYRVFVPEGIHNSANS